jgi:hypothetical protein
MLRLVDRELPQYTKTPRWRHFLEIEGCQIKNSSVLVDLRPRTSKGNNVGECKLQAICRSGAVV